MSMFMSGDAVICIDAADIPSPPWTPIQAGHSYVIRAVDPIPLENGNYDKNIHKHARFQVRLWGISNPIHPVFGVEMGYAFGVCLFSSDILTIHCLCFCRLHS